MKRNRLASLVAAVMSLAMIPLLWIVAFDALPTLAVVRAETSGGRVGPWAFAWAIVWIATLSCLGVAWLCYATFEDAN
jgi:hypothetical protein